MKKDNIKTNIILSSFYQILVILIPFITTPYIARVLGAKNIGIYSYTLSIQTYFSLFAALGTVSYGSREIARNRENYDVRSKIFWEIELLTVVTSSICLLLWSFITLFSRDYRIYFLILSVNILNVMFDISWFYTGIEKFKYTILQNSIFRILGTVMIFVFVNTPNDLVKYVLILSLSNFLGTISMWIYLPKFIKKVNLKELNIFRHFKETLVYFIPTIATSIYTVLDKTLIGMFIKDKSENGYYDQATNIINVGKALTFSAVNTVLGSRISYLYSNKKFDEIKQRINTSINYILFLGIGLLFGIVSMINDFVPFFYGPGYDKVIILLKLMSPLIIIIGISNCIGSHYYTPSGNRLKSAKFIIVGAVINLILNLILIPIFSSVGAVIASLIAEIIITYLYLKYCDGYLKFNTIIKYAYKKIIAGLVMFISLYYINLLSFNFIIGFIAEVIIGLLIYVVVLLILKDNFVTYQFNKYVKGNK